MKPVHQDCVPGERYRSLKQELETYRALFYHAQRALKGAGITLPYRELLALSRERLACSKAVRRKRWAVLKSLRAKEVR